MSTSVLAPRARQGARRAPRPKHASERRGFCHTHDRTSSQVRPRNYGDRVGGSTFLEVDPVEGGCANDYAYVTGDPVNSFDLTGQVQSCNNAQVAGNGGIIHLRWKPDIRQYEFQVNLFRPFSAFAADFKMDIYMSGRDKRLHRRSKYGKRGTHQFHGQFNNRYGKKGRYAFQPGTELRLRLNVALYDNFGDRIGSVVGVLRCKV